MRITSTDNNPSPTPSVTLTMSPQVALDIATAMLRGTLDEPKPLASVVSIGVALCDVVYGSDSPIVEASTCNWAVESTDSSPAPTKASLADTLQADLRELARFRREEQEKAVDVISAVLRLEEPLEVFVNV